MNKRPTRDSFSQQRLSKSPVTGQLGFGTKTRAAAGSIKLKVAGKGGSKLLYRDTSGKAQVIEVVEAPQMNKDATRIYYGKIQSGPRIFRGIITDKRPAKEPVLVHRKEMNDPHLTLLSGSAFDAVVETLDNPPAPSAGARQAVARTRLWRR